MKTRALIICAALIALPVFAGPAAAKTETARLGSVSATFSYGGNGLRYRHLRLKIVDGGIVRHDGPVRSRFCRHYCGPLQLGTGQSALRVVDLAPQGPPSVVLSLFTERAHCCAVEQVYSPVPGRHSYAKHEHNFGNAGATLKDLGGNGRLEFVSADNAFYYAFASYAASGAPIEIWTYTGHGFDNVTRSNPHAIANDARRWWRMFSYNYADGEGFIAAWAADEYLLRHYKLVARVLTDEAQQGHLQSDMASAAPTGEQFVSALQQFLRLHGYRR